MADGQVTMGGMVVKPNVKKTRKIGDHCIGGFAGGRAEKEHIFRSARRHPSTALLSVAATVSRQQHCQERRHRRRCRWCRAGATADAFTLFERLEAKLEEHPGEGSRAGYSGAGGLQRTLRCAARGTGQRPGSRAQGPAWGGFDFQDRVRGMLGRRRAQARPPARQVQAS